MRPTLGIALVVFAAGCAASHSAQLAREQWPAAAARAICESLEQCWPSSAAEIAYVAHVSIDACAEQLLRDGYLTYLEQRITDSTRYDGVLAAECVEALASSCWSSVLFTVDPFEAIAACRGAFVGMLAEGAACTSSPECAPGLWCERPGTLCPGVCRPRLATGLPCAAHFQCARPDSEQFAYCAASLSGAGVCAQATLAFDAAQGEPCDVVLVSTGDHRIVFCAPELSCTYGDSTTKHCLAPLPAGAACSRSSRSTPCVVGYACLPEDTPDGTCERVEISAAGEPCDGVRGSPQCDPSAPLVCRDGRCLFLPELAEGAACADAGGPIARCTEGLTCMGDTHRCERPRPSGATCSFHRECAALQCDYDTNLCVDPATACSSST